MYAPVVNINGTSAEQLLEQWTNALEAVLQALLVVQKCSPHGRDYQTVPQEEYRLARQQHIRWLEQLDTIHKQIEEVTINIHGQYLDRDPKYYGKVKP